MRTRRLIGGASTFAMSFALYSALLMGGVAAQSECTMTVEPKQAVAGAEFHLRGSGFVPTQLILQKNDGAPTTIELDLGGQDPFDIPIGSRTGDEGVWTAIASVPGGCSATVTFTATLENTDMIDDLLRAPATNGHLPLLLVLGTMALGLSGGAFVAWRLNRA